MQASCIRWLICGYVCSLLACVAAADEADTKPMPAGKRELKRPSTLTKYDLATPDDLFISYLLDPLCEVGQSKKWPIFADLSTQVGGWVTDFISAEKVATAIAHGMPIQGQPIKYLDEMTKDCCEILCIDKAPTVYVRNSLEEKCYIVETSDEVFLVITSGLLNLYGKKSGEERTDELRFVIGRELGHYKCNHFKMRRIAMALIAILANVDASVVPEKFRMALPTLAMGRFFTWARESEISADRAGLLCCQDWKVASSAMIRQLHGLRTDSAWIAEGKEFDEDEIIRNFKRWESEPFVKFVLNVKRYSAESPFIPERLAALKRWHKSGNYQDIIARTASDAGRQFARIETISLVGVSPQSAPIVPYLVIKDEKGNKLAQTTNGTATANVSWTKIDVSFAQSNGRPLFVEIWQSKTGYDKIVGGFMVLPTKDVSQFNVPIVRDWNARSEDDTQGLARIIFTYSLEE